MLKTELSIKEYEKFKIQHDSDNIVNKNKGITNKIKEYDKDIAKINEKIIHCNIKIQENFNVFNDIMKKRDSLEEMVSKCLNEPLGSSLNVCYNSLKLQVEKMDNEFGSQIRTYEVKKRDWEINKLMQQIMVRDKAIEATLNELKKKGVTQLSLDKEKENIRLIEDYHIEPTIVFQPTKGEVNYQSVEEIKFNPPSNLSTIPVKKSLHLNKSPEW